MELKSLSKICAFMALYMFQVTVAYPFPVCGMKDSAMPIEVLPAPTTTNMMAGSPAMASPVAFNAESLYPFAAVQALTSMPGYEGFHLPLSRSFRSNPFQYMFNEDPQIAAVAPDSWSPVSMPMAAVMQQPTYYPENTQTMQQQVQQETQTIKEAESKTSETGTVERVLENERAPQTSNGQTVAAVESTVQKVEDAPLSVEIPSQSFKYSEEGNQEVEHKKDGREVFVKTVEEAIRDDDAVPIVAKSVSVEQEKTVTTEEHKEEEKETVASAVEIAPTETKSAEDIVTSTSTEGPAPLETHLEETSISATAEPQKTEESTHVKRSAMDVRHLVYPPHAHHDAEGMHFDAHPQHKRSVHVYYY